MIGPGAVESFAVVKAHRAGRHFAVNELCLAALRIADAVPVLLDGKFADLESHAAPVVAAGSHHQCPVVAAHIDQGDRCGHDVRTVANLPVIPILMKTNIARASFLIHQGRLIEQLIVPEDDAITGQQICSEFAWARIQGQFFHRPSGPPDIADLDQALRVGQAWEVPAGHRTSAGFILLSHDVPDGIREPFQLMLGEYRFWCDPESVPLKVFGGCHIGCIRGRSSRR